MQPSQPVTNSHTETSPTPYSSTDFITLSKAAQLAPGRPSSNAMWRWARRGVLARSGERIRLEHIRVGGKIFTTAGWVREFGERLAAADARHFQQRGGTASSLTDHSARNAQADRELTEAGL